MIKISKFLLFCLLFFSNSGVAQVDTEWEFLNSPGPIFISGCFGDDLPLSPSEGMRSAVLVGNGEGFDLYIISVELAFEDTLIPEIRGNQALKPGKTYILPEYLGGLYYIGEKDEKFSSEKWMHEWRGGQWGLYIIDFLSQQPFTLLKQERTPEKVLQLSSTIPCPVEAPPEYFPDDLAGFMRDLKQKEESIMSGLFDQTGDFTSKEKFGMLNYVFGTNPDVVFGTGCTVENSSNFSKDIQEGKSKFVILIQGHEIRIFGFEEESSIEQLANIYLKSDFYQRWDDPSPLGFNSIFNVISDDPKKGSLTKDLLNYFFTGDFEPVLSINPETFKKLSEESYCEKGR